MRAELDEALEAINALRDTGARVHSITNTVAQNFTANVLLACGAIPSMTVNPDEVNAFTKRSDALHINLGTLDSGRIHAIDKSIAVAKTEGKTMLLDPVMAHISPLRADFARKYADAFSIIRGNADEITALNLENNQNLCIVQTGKEDRIMYARKEYCVLNGHPVMSQVIATGCALGALIAALSAKSNSPSTASIAGLLWFGVAGEIAAEKSSGPGSFKPAFVDCLNTVTLDQLKFSARFK